MGLGSVRIAFVGDLVAPAASETIQIAANLEGLYDFAVCNLEGSHRSDTPRYKLANLHNSPEALRVLFDNLKIRYANLANNHVMDYGERGLEQLMTLLNDMGVGYFGAGLTKTEAMEPLFVDSGDIRLGFVGFSWKPIESVGATDAKAGVTLIPSLGTLCRGISDLRKECSHVIVSFHWGYEYERYPLPLHRKVAHAVIDAGASVVIGHHPHVYQGIETYRGGLIYYSLGNCYMAWPVKLQGDIGIVPILEFDTNSVTHVNTLYAVRDRASDAFLMTDRCELDPTVEELSKPFSLDDAAYEKFFRRNRVRRRGLPVFTGTPLDGMRYAWLDVRSFIVRTAVRLGLWP